MKPKLLLDTHIWIWYAKGDRQRLTTDASRRLEAWDEQGALFLSVMSVWELGLLDAKGRIHLALPVSKWLDTFFARTRFQVIGLDISVALDANRLPGGFHSDPVDRILVATARHHGLTLLTEDKQILDYARQGYLSGCSAGEAKLLNS